MSSCGAFIIKKNVDTVMKIYACNTPIKTSKNRARALGMAMDAHQGKRKYISAIKINPERMLTKRRIPSEMERDRSDIILSGAKRKIGLIQSLKCSAPL